MHFKKTKRKPQRIFIAENIIGNNFSIKLSINIFIQVQTPRVELNHSCGSCFQNMTTPFWLKISNSNFFSFITNDVVRFTVQINIETICQSKCIYHTSLWLKMATPVGLLGCWQWQCPPSWWPSLPRGGHQHCDLLSVWWPSPPDTE